MRSYDIWEYSSSGREALNLAYVRQAEYLVDEGQVMRVDWTRLVRMLHFCLNEGLDAEEVLHVLGRVFDLGELQKYCKDLGVWKDAYREMEALAGSAKS